MCFTCKCVLLRWCQGGASRFVSCFLISIGEHHALERSKFQRYFCHILWCSSLYFVLWCTPVIKIETLKDYWSKIPRYVRKKSCNKIGRWRNHVSSWPWVENVTSHAHLACFNVFLFLFYMYIMTVLLISMFYCSFPSMRNVGSAWDVDLHQKLVFSFLQQLLMPETKSKIPERRKVTEEKEQST